MAKKVSLRERLFGMLARRDEERYVTKMERLRAAVQDVAEDKGRFSVDEVAAILDENELSQGEFEALLDLYETRKRLVATTAGKSNAAKQAEALRSQLQAEAEAEKVRREKYDRDREDAVTRLHGLDAQYVRAVDAEFQLQESAAIFEYPASLDAELRRLNEAIEVINDKLNANANPDQPLGGATFGHLDNAPGRMLAQSEGRLSRPEKLGTTERAELERMRDAAKVAIAQAKLQLAKLCMERDAVRKKMTAPSDWTLKPENFRITRRKGAQPVAVGAA